ncbi:hypothetical protein BLA29_003492, partial [Euroglyphus maynei]
MENVNEPNTSTIITLTMPSSTMDTTAYFPIQLVNMEPIQIPIQATAKPSYILPKTAHTTNRTTVTLKRTCRSNHVHRRPKRQVTRSRMRLFSSDQDNNISESESSTSMAITPITSDNESSMETKHPGNMANNNQWFLLATGQTTAQKEVTKQARTFLQSKNHVSPPQCQCSPKQRRTPIVPLLLVRCVTTHRTIVNEKTLVVNKTIMEFEGLSNQLEKYNNLQGEIDELEQILQGLRDKSRELEKDVYEDKYVNQISSLTEENQKLMLDVHLLSYQCDLLTFNNNNRNASNDPYAYQSTRLQNPYMGSSRPFIPVANSNLNNQIRPSWLFIRNQVEPYRNVDDDILSKRLPNTNQIAANLQPCKL